MRSGFWGTLSLLIQITLGFVTAGLAFASFIYTLLSFNDYGAGLWSFFCGIMSLSVVHLHILFLKHNIDEWYDPEHFESFKLLGIFVCSFALIFFGYYLSYGITRHEDFNLSKSGHYNKAILSGLALAWGINLIVSSQKYKRFVELCDPGQVGNRYFRL